MKFIILIIFVLVGCDLKTKKEISAYLTEEVSCTLNEYLENKCYPIQVDDSKVRKEKKHRKLEALELKIVRNNSYGFIDLDGDGEDELFVYKNGDPGYCGSGGCSLFIYLKKGNHYQKFHEFSVVKTPIIISDTKTNGFRDIFFWQWRFDRFGFYHVARYMKGKYPSNPTVLPYLKDGYEIRGEHLFSLL